MKKVKRGFCNMCGKKDVALHTTTEYHDTGNSVSICVSCDEETMKKYTGKRQNSGVRGNA